jgi:hypothetical protein
LVALSSLASAALSLLVAALVSARSSTRRDAMPARAAFTMMREPSARD